MNTSIGWHCIESHAHITDHRQIVLPVFVPYLQVLDEKVTCRQVWLHNNLYLWLCNDRENDTPEFD